jgi:hypothetical protein
MQRFSSGVQRLQRWTPEEKRCMVGEISLRDNSVSREVRMVVSPPSKRPMHWLPARCPATAATSSPLLFTVHPMLWTRIDKLSIV